MEYSSAYTKTISWYFEVNGIGFAIVFINRNKSMVVIEETRKNGQEDTHLGGAMHLTDDGIWKLDAAFLNQIMEYEGEDLADALESYLNTHGLPEE